MKTIVVSLCAAFKAFLLFGPAFGHSGDKVEADYDPVETEFGAYEPGLHADRTIKMEMSDTMRFTPDVIRVKQGEVVKIVHHNTGKLLHEFVLGTPASLDEHAELMKKFPNMEHAEPYMAHVQPGEKMEMIWKFSKAGRFAFGCLVPGHYDAGMKGTVVVE